MAYFSDEVLKFLEHEALDCNMSIVSQQPQIIHLKGKEEQTSCLLVLHQISDRKEAHLKLYADYKSSASVKAIHVWEDLWEFKKDKVQSKLVSLLGKSAKIHGRKTSVNAINNDELLSFLLDNHLNIPIKAKFKYGLFLQERLVAVMSFSKGRKIVRDGTEYNSYELLRFCNKLNHTIVGGFSKLLRHFIKVESPDDIMTYVDKDWSDGLNYERMGFQFENELAPLEFWLNESTGERLYPNRELEQYVIKPGDTDKIKKSLSETLVRVYNSGSYKYVLKLK